MDQSIARNDDEQREVATYDWCRGVEALPIKNVRLKLFLHVLARAVGYDGSTTYIGRQQLAFALKVSQDHISRLTRQAKAAGWLDVGNRGCGYNEYRLLIQPLSTKEFNELAAETPSRQIASSNPTNPQAQPDIHGDAKATNPTSPPDCQASDHSLRQEHQGGDRYLDHSSVDHRARTENENESNQALKEPEAPGPQENTPSQVNASQTHRRNPFLALTKGNPTNRIRSEALRSKTRRPNPRLALRERDRDTALRTDEATTELLRARRVIACAIHHDLIEGPEPKQDEQAIDLAGRLVSEVRRAWEYETLRDPALAKLLELAEA